MNFLDHVNRFVYLFVETMSRAGRGRIWLLLLLNFGAHWLALTILNNVSSPLLGGIARFWTELVDPQKTEAFTHYPAQYFYLGNYYAYAKWAVGGILEGPVLVLVAGLFADTYATREAAAVRRPWYFFWLNATACWIVLNVMMVLVALYLPKLAEPLLNGPRRMMAFGFVVMPFAFVLMFTLLLFSIARVAIKGEHALQAMGRSVMTVFHQPFMCFFMSVAIISVPILIGLMAGQPAQIIESFRPELVYWLLLAGLASNIIANFFWMGATTKFILEIEK